MAKTNGIKSKETPDYQKTRNSLDAAIKDQSAYGVSQGVTSTYIIPFAVALNVSPLMTTLVSFLPDLVGSTLQLMVNSLMSIFQSRKKMLVVFALLEALTWLPLIIAPYIGSKILLILIALILNSILQNMIDPLWSSLMTDIVDEHQRGRYFGKRMKALGMVTFISTAAAALILGFSANVNIFIGFSILFATAFITRLISTYYLTRIKDVSYRRSPKEDFSILSFSRKLNKTNFGRLVMTMMMFNFAIAFVGPFYIIYMQGTLHFSYFSIMMIVLAQVLASFITMDFWGKTVDKHGSKKVLTITGFLIALGPLAWIFTKEFAYLLIIEFMAGVFMAGFKLAAANFVFDSTRPQVRLKCLSYYNFFTSIMLFAGALAGSAIYSFMPALIQNPVYVLLGISAALKLAFAFIAFPHLKEERLLEIEIKRPSSKYSLTVIPVHGVVYDVLGHYRTPIALAESQPAAAPSPYEMHQDEKDKLTKRFVDRVVNNYDKKFKDY